MRLFVALWSVILVGLSPLAPAWAAEPAPAPAQGTLLLHEPAVSQDHLAFVYAGDIWVTDRAGQHPARLTSHGSAQRPYFSPDGRMIAYSAAYDSNIDVYVIPVTGGEPKRLTFHPGADIANGWSTDGARVLFSSNREIGNNRSNQLFEVALTGGFEHKVMEAVAFEGTWSPDNKRLAYIPYLRAYRDGSGWRLSRGGATPPLWIIDPAANILEKVPHENATDQNPIWLGDDIVFISDRDNQAQNLFGYNTKTKSVRQLTKETMWDVHSAGGYKNNVVFEAGGALKELDLTTGAVKPIVIDISTETAQSRPQWKDASKTITSAQLSPTGKRVVISARGDIFTVPVKDGSVRNLTATSGIREDDGIWSPDGKQIAYISENKFQHFISLRDQAGLEAPKSYPLPKPFYYSLLGWSPDGKRLALQDNHLHLFAFSLEKGELTKLDETLNRDGRTRSLFQADFSPDGRYLTYVVSGENHLGRIKLYDFTTSKSYDVTDGLANAGNPVFGPKDYLYFTMSINAGPTRVGLDMSTQERALRSGIYALVLAGDGKSPLLPKSGDEEVKKSDAKADEKPAEKSDKADKLDKPAKPTKIDLDGLSERIVALPLAEKNYDGLGVASDGSLYYLDVRQPGSSIEPPDAIREDDSDLYRFDFTEKKAKQLKANIAGYDLSGDRKKILISYGKGKLEIADTGEKFEAKPIDLSKMQIRVDPPQEWRQIFDETWWMEREFFYDPKMHGLDWDAVYARYSPLVKFVKRREDLTKLLVEMIAELQVAHNRTGGGDVPREAPSRIGLLGADFAVEGDHYRFKTIYRGDPANPFFRSPLSVPGASVKEGDYLQAVNGVKLTAAQNIYELFENTQGKQTALTISTDAAGKSSRTVTVEPVASEVELRRWAWIENNRQIVARKTQGKVGYVYLPNTADAGFQYFNRMYFAQIDKQAVILDERHNGGGQTANYIIELLGRPYLAGWKDRDAIVYNTPGAAIYGPKVMLIDQDAGSGGDFLPWSFKYMKLGPTVGTRTWGGLIGISVNPPLMDGGSLTVPFFRFFTPNGEWRVENEGVSPDIEVELDPTLVNKGQDAQLDAGIATALKNLSEYKPIDRKTAPPVPTQLGK